MIGGDFDTPIMHQDLANYTMSPMAFGSMVGGGIGSTSYLGGIKMAQQPDHDKLELINRKNEEGKNTFKKAMIGIGACLLLGFITYFRKNISKAGGIGNYLKNLFKTKPAPAPKTSTWKNVKNWFSNAFTKMKGKPNKWGRFKAWSGAKWDAFKNLFKKKP